jgi:hypothetical protein
VAEVSLEQAAQSRLLLSKVPSPRHWLVDMGSHEGKQKDLVFVRSNFKRGRKTTQLTNNQPRIATREHHG